MANSDKEILITPNKGQSSFPEIKFTGADNAPVYLRVLDDGSVSIEGTNGQLFSVTDSMTGTIFSVNDVSGIPAIEVLDTGVIRLGAYGGAVYSPGSVVQAVYVRTDNRTTYAANTSGNGTTITDLNMTITPKFATSRLIMQWMISGEVHHDTTLVIHKNGNLITDAGVTGYNSVAGNVRSSGYVSGIYDTDVNSTQELYFVQYSQIAGTTSSVTFAPATRSSTSTAYTFAINRTINGTIGDGQESAVSTGVCWEVAV